MSESLIFNLDVNTSQAVSDINEFFNTFEQGAAQAKSKLNTAFGQKLQTTVEVQFKNGEVVAKKIQNIKQESNRLADVYKAVNGELGRTPNQLKKQISILTQLRNNTEKFSRTTGKVTQDWKTLTTRISAANRELGKMGQGGSMIGQMKQALTGFAPMFTLVQTASNLATSAILGVIRAIGDLGPAMIERAKEVENLQLTLSGFLNSQAEVDAVMASSKAIALTYGASLTEVEKAYKRLAPTILAAGGNLQDTQDVIVAMTARTTQLGLSSEQTSRYMEAIAQVFGKGTLQAEELTKQLSQMDGALRSQLDSYVKANTGFSSLAEAMKAGAVDAQLFKDAFIAVSQDAVERLAGEMFSLQESFDSLTIQQVQNKIETLNTISLDSLNNTFNGFGESMLRIQAAVSQFFSSVTTSLPNLTGAFKALMDALGVTLELLVNGFLVGLKVVLNVIDLSYKSVMNLVNALKSIPGFDGLIQGAQNLNAAFMDSFRTGVDMILGVGDATKDGISLMNEFGEEVTVSTANLEEMQKRIADAFEEEKKRLDEMKAVAKERFDEEKEAHKEKQDAIKEAMEQEKDEYKQMKEIVKEKYDEEDRRIKDKLDALREAYELERGKIEEKTQAEQRLEEIRRKELTDKANNLQLTEKERLEAIAALERMDRRVKLAELDKKYNEDKNRLTKEGKANEEERDAVLRTMKKSHEEEMKIMEKKYKAEKDAIADIDQEWKQLARNIEQAKQNELRDIITNRNTAVNAINAQIGRVNALAAAYREAAAAAASVNSGSGSEGRASGGPVSGGSTYTVNELGKEAFLSASGKLSMINAPAWGEWRAPSRGTVIPAHLTQQLDIPAKGINLNGSPAMNAAASSGNLSGLVRAISSLSGGDNIQNSVTIQSASPSQTASDVLVTLAKLKRLRYS